MTVLELVFPKSTNSLVALGNRQVCNKFGGGQRSERLLGLFPKIIFLYSLLSRSTAPICGVIRKNKYFSTSVGEGADWCPVAVGRESYRVLGNHTLSSATEVADASGSRILVGGAVFTLHS